MRQGLMETTISNNEFVTAYESAYRKLSLKHVAIALNAIHIPTVKAIKEVANKLENTFRLVLERPPLTSGVVSSINLGGCCYETNFSSNPDLLNVGNKRLDGLFSELKWKYLDKKRGYVKTISLPESVINFNRKKLMLLATMGGTKTDNLVYSKLYIGVDWVWLVKGLPFYYTVSLNKFMEVLTAELKVNSSLWESKPRWIDLNLGQHPPFYGFSIYETGARDDLLQHLIDINRNSQKFNFLSNESNSYEVLKGMIKNAEGNISGDIAKLRENIFSRYSVISSQ